MTIIPLAWLVDLAVDALAPRAPSGALRFRFDDGAVERVENWQEPTIRQKVLIRINNAIEAGEIRLLDALGMVLRGYPEPLPLKAVIKSFAVSRDDAGKILALCGLDAKLLTGKTVKLSEGDHSRLSVLEAERNRRTSGLAEINAARQELVDFAQELAKKEWDADTGRTIRVGAMCARIYADVYQHAEEKNISGLVPEEQDGIKPWLRDVAPLYAKKGGRPPKKK